LVSWTTVHFGIECCGETIRQTLKQLGLFWKKARKLLNKADTDKRAEFLETLKGLLGKALQQGHLLIYIDEAHIHLNTDEGYGWSVKGERFWISSSSPGRTKVSFYGVYLYNLAQVRIFPYEKADRFNTIDVLKQLRVEFPDLKMRLVWDGAPDHRVQEVAQAASALEISLEPLPVYSPDFMPVKHLWQWLRANVTYHTCYHSKAELIEQVS